MASLAGGQVGVTGSTPARAAWERDWTLPWTSRTWDRPLDEGIEDVGPTGTSLRWFSSPLRVPTAFEDVYRDPDGRLVRRDGALEAVFPRSSYQTDRDGVFAAIPAGVEYRIRTGDRPWEEHRESPWAIRAGVDLRVVGRAIGRAVERRVGPTPAPRSANPREGDGIAGEDAGSIAIWTSEAYRRARLAALIGRASDPR